MSSNRRTTRPDEAILRKKTSTEINPMNTTIEDAYSLSPMQHGMLFHSLLAPNSGVDIEQLYCELHEALDVAAFQRAWRCVIERHPILRTSFSWRDVAEP